MPIHEGWLADARRVPSPNHNARPAGEVSLLVLHSISLPPGEFAGDAIERLFTNRLEPDAHPFFAEIAGLRVSAHLLIRRDGECVQFVPFHDRAWHAGRSRWRDGGVEREGLNDFSVGIELEGDEVSPYTAAQYEALARATRALLAGYPAMSEARITSHAHVAPLRKTDPGPAFDWAYFRQRLAATAILS
ncbi:MULTISPECIES: 1,6-anhydro-N-acetylmuramyl-L-alanine amidase AmpD [Halomonas]|uniref:1,6-anhydro-N-acetylmuramyl-L-alanine amidase AmpD n=1 Tax=Halomonas halophila TaxID=29573 RepID=A0ABQ0U7W9_9GAMM|nr:MULTISPECIES: 1,6-anhydro-N-acetylmuramyl-L-alanine amidase AmpD [Halomonas]PSJ23106.1 1,6-anhydro-N-acetylmuramyl-L-alanine amidase AmpD [Halomonas sp. ND22Bw]MDR5889889.1 1,6-anhydro-N-acetylmuramyl-L-alanine amidase AmpD [Halomonas salina]RAH38820.1 1,6-anhydro-N-acetylmuramyl-L-alanine amidase AmpD [Halomonas sp. SL1]WJY06709.1 1,6-anhydro-N-acetylmuramyl-L-alanine amidase AmpD [Halomonas halophila]GEK74271.1 N-acetyl-anhydromuranmyl-L-alanine amidase [Halomonas halophila]